LQIYPTAEYLSYDNCKELSDINVSNDNDIYDQDDDEDDDNDDNNKDDDEEVDRIVDHNEGNNISSISGDSETTGTTTVSVNSFETLPKEFRDGLFCDTLFPLMLFTHYYGTKPSMKKVFFNVYKFFNKNKNKNTAIKLLDYVTYTRCQKSKLRFVFAGIVCKYAEYYKYHIDNKRMTSKYLV